MQRLLLAMLCVLSFAHGIARAEGEAACTSIVERDCAPLPRVSVDHNLRVEILTRKRSLSFPLSTAADIGDELTAACPGGKCTATSASSISNSRALYAACAA
jgi:hypothetical protein